MVGELFSSDIREKPKGANEKETKASWKNSIAKKTLNDGIHKYIVNAEFLQCVVDINIPTKKNF